MWHNLDEQYAVDKLGRVKSYKWGKERILKPGKDKDGYLVVNLYTDHKRKTYKISRLVAESFIPNPYNLPEVNHKNGIKADNRVENLEWSTTEDNLKHAFENGLHSTPKCPIIAMLPDRSREWQFESINEASKKTKISAGSICMCCKGLRQTAGGLTWSYVS